MRFRCPHCADSIDHLCYNVKLTEFGSFSLPDLDDCDPEDVYNGDHDSETADDYGEYYYECPECGDEISLETLKHQAEEFAEEDHEQEPNQPIAIREDQDDPSSTRISIEQKFVSSCTGGKGRTIFCPKCLHENIVDPGEDLTECPTCGKPITKK